MILATDNIRQIKKVELESKVTAAASEAFVGNHENPW